MTRVVFHYNHHADRCTVCTKARLDDVAPLLKGMEKLAEKFSDDPEQTLPEAGPLESARSYREKKAKADQNPRYTSQRSFPSD